MSHTVTITYDRALIRRALNRFMIRRLGKSFFVLVPVLSLLLIWSFFYEGWNWFSILLTIVLGAVAAFLGFVYFARLRASEGFFDKADEPTVTFTFSETGVRTDSDLGSSDLKWTVFEEILKFEEVWLLVYAKSGYMTLPVGQITSDCLQFIERQVQERKN
ncbi:MAG: hypothetical protein R2747_24790 [Pyrinomonadaceae bacterium]